MILQKYLQNVMICILRNLYEIDQKVKGDYFLNARLKVYYLCLFLNIFIFPIFLSVVIFNEFLIYSKIFSVLVYPDLAAGF